LFRPKPISISELPEFSSSGNLARLLGVTRTTIRAWWRRGILPPPLELGTRCLRWPRGVILKYLDALERRVKARGGKGVSA
jgi:predicted DNA-binding transcriptional regulator AlpA